MTELRRGVISFTKRLRVRHRRSVHLLRLATAILALTVCTVGAQVQEKKLIDRLLEPDMSLQNNAQNKQFATRGSTTTKQARTKSFYVRERKREKEFSGVRNFFAKMFRTRRSRYSDVQANLKTRSQVKTPQIPASTSAYATAPPALASNKRYDTSEFSGSRPFLARGKSQKALSAQDRPLTIDEVRELLNKNK
jgi:hypothetical protein